MMMLKLLIGSMCALLSVEAQSDGNPHHWDRKRRCDHTDYAPKCGACEGVGGIVRSDAKDDIDVVACKVEANTSNPKRPIWGDPFTELASHEILIGKKMDPACFQAFPSNDSTATNCYKPQEVQLWSEMKTKKALVLKANQAGNAWGLVGNVTSYIYHQGVNMWIVNHLPLTVTQTICTEPREGGDQTKPAVNAVQYNWVDNLFFVATETLDVEYGVGSMELDHWAFGPHHAWTDPASGLIVRMWQPFNGLQIFTPGNWKTEITPEGQGYLAELAADGKTAPKAAMPGGSTFRIKCGADGFHKNDTAEEVALGSNQPAGDAKASSSDLKRARTKVPRATYKGDDFESMSSLLNKWMLKEAPNSRSCDEFSVEELQRLQIMLFMLRDPQLNTVYDSSADARRMPHDIEVMSKEWESLNAEAARDPELARMHRDGHCHETVMWYVHHLPQSLKAVIKDQAALPLLSKMRHDILASKPHAVRIHRAYEEKVSCASCHSAVFPSGETGVISV
jgi:hypothetical protein